MLEGRAVVFEGPEDYHARIEDPGLDIDEHCVLFIRGAGPIGYPGGAEVVNMQPPAALIKRGVHWLACVGDGRQSGTTSSPSVLNASPEAAAGGRLALVRPATACVSTSTSAPLTCWSAMRSSRFAKRRSRRPGLPGPGLPAPWQEIQRSMVDQFSEGMVLKPATKYQRVAQVMGVPRDNH